MNKIEYIRQSHKLTNVRLRKWLDAKYQKLNERNHFVALLWRGIAWIIFGVVSFISWLSFVVSIFVDSKYTTHYMECEIANGKLSDADTHKYLINKQLEYTRRLSYGSVSPKEQRRVEKTFEYLFSLYPVPNIEEEDPADDRHREVVENIAEVKEIIVAVADYTEKKQEEEAERKEKEATLIAQAQKRKEINLNRSGFEPIPIDFCPRLTENQIEILVRNINIIGIFKRDITAREIELILICKHTESLQCSHNKLLALLLESLSIARLITPKWQRVADKYNCFTSKQGKHLTAKDLSSAKQQADIIDPKKYDMITQCIEELKSGK